MKIDKNFGGVVNIWNDMRTNIGISTLFIVSISIFHMTVPGEYYSPATHKHSEKILLKKKLLFKSI